MLLMSTRKPVSASMNVIMVASGPAALCMPGPDSNFKDNLVKFSVSLAIQNPHPTIPEFAWLTLGN